MNATHELVHPDEKRKHADVLRSKQMDFLLWLLMVDLTIDAEPQPQQELQTFVHEHPNEPLVFSMVPHTGHPDSLYVYKAIEHLTPEIISSLKFVSAKDTWSSWMSRMLARVVAGEPYLFDRETLTMESMRAQIQEMKQILRPENELAKPESLAIYPQGTRTIGAPIANLPAVVAGEADVPLAILNIYGAERVMPKVPKGTQTAQIINILIQRMHTWKSRHQVTIRLMDFIPADTHRKEKKERLMAAHTTPFASE